MKVQTHTLTDRTLRYAVALAEGLAPFVHHEDGTAWIVTRHPSGAYKPVPNYASGGAGDDIIDREKIATYWDGHCDVWVAKLGSPYHHSGPDRRTAAMRCWVTRKLGELVDIPDELLMLGQARNTCKHYDRGLCLARSGVTTQTRWFGLLAVHRHVEQRPSCTYSNDVWVGNACVPGPSDRAPVQQHDCPLYQAETLRAHPALAVKLHGVATFYPPEIAPAEPAAPALNSEHH